MGKRVYTSQIFSILVIGLYICPIVTIKVLIRSKGDDTDERSTLLVLSATLALKTHYWRKYELLVPPNNEN